MSEPHDKPQRPSSVPESAASGPPTASPGTDPTSPIPQESTGQWTRAEQENGRRLDEPGLAEQDRKDRR